MIRTVKRERISDAPTQDKPWSVRVRWQFNRWTCWWPERLETARGKALRVWAHSTLEGVANTAEAWSVWAAAHPDDPRSTQQPFTAVILARTQIAWLPPLPLRPIAAMAAVWDQCKDGNMPCSGCWQHSAARRALDYALADAMGWTRASMDEAAAQVAAAHRLLSSVLGAPPPPSHCEMPSHCTAVADAGEAALVGLAAA